MIDVFVAIDVETSGFSKEAQILEVAVMHFWQGRIVRRYSELVCPVNLTWEDEKIKQALAVNGLSVEALMYGASTFRKMHERFESEVSEPYWVIHYSDFDLRMLQQEYDRLGLPMPKPERVFCTKKLDELIHPNNKGHKLEDLCTRWGVMNPSTHRAFGDAEAAGQIFSKMMEVLPQDPEELGEFYDRGQTLQWWNTIRGR